MIGPWFLNLHIFLGNLNLLALFLLYLHTLPGKLTDWPCLVLVQLIAPLEALTLCLMSSSFGLLILFSSFSGWGLSLGEACQHAAGETCVSAVNTAIEQDRQMPIPGGRFAEHYYSFFSRA